MTVALAVVDGLTTRLALKDTHRSIKVEVEGRRMGRIEVVPVCVFSQCVYLFDWI